MYNVKNTCAVWTAHFPFKSLFFRVVFKIVTFGVPLPGWKLISLQSQHLRKMTCVNYEDLFSNGLSGESKSISSNNNLSQLMSLISRHTLESTILIKFHNLHSGWWASICYSSYRFQLQTKKNAAALVVILGKRKRELKTTMTVT